MFPMQFPHGNSAALQAFLAKIRAAQSHSLYEKSVTYDFDFKKEVPIQHPGARFEWTQVCPGAATTAKSGLEPAKGLLGSAPTHESLQESLGNENGSLPRDDTEHETEDDDSVEGIDAEDSLENANSEDKKMQGGLKD